MTTKDMNNTSSEEEFVDSCLELDMWKPSPKVPKPVAQSPEKSNSDALFMKKFQEQRSVLEVQKNEQHKALQKKIEKRRLKRKRKAEERKASKESEQSSKLAEEEWQKVRPFMTVYDHIHGPVGHGKYGPKTELENQIDSSLSNDNLEEAEKLSDKIAVHEFGVKVSRAFAAQRAAEQKYKDDQAQVARKQKRLAWGFEAKERWQMKGNM